MNNPQPKPIKVYVTEYALTSGVFLMEARISECGRFVTGKIPRGEMAFEVLLWDKTFTIGKSAFFNLEEAKADFEKRKASSIKSTEKKLQRLKNLEFSFWV